MSALGINMTDREAPVAWNSVKPVNHNQHCPKYNELMGIADVHYYKAIELRDQAQDLWEKGIITRAEYLTMLKDAESQEYLYANKRDEAIQADFVYWMTEVNAQMEDSRELHQMEEQLRHGG